MYDLIALQQKPLLERKEAAFYLRISVAHLDNIIRKGELAVTRIGRRVLIKSEILDQWIDAQTGKKA